VDEDEYRPGAMMSVSHSWSHSERGSMFYLLHYRAILRVILTHYLPMIMKTDRHIDKSDDQLVSERH
jgi:hypothetical protein